MTWVQSLESLDYILSSRKFRHGISAVRASSIADQYYCELKVELEYVQGEVETIASQEGTILHEELLAMEETTQEQMIQDIQQRPLYVASFLLAAKLMDIIVVGIPDAIVFEKGAPTFVIELKTTRGTVDRLWKSQEVQAKTYALLLDQMGFDCSNLKAAVVKLKKDFLDEDDKERFLRASVKALITNNTLRLESTYNGALKVFLLNHNRQNAYQDIEWAQNYWLGKREPIPNKQPAKCRSCVYKETCPSNSYI